MISAIIPVFNGEKYLAQAVQSILDQDYADFELILIDNDSTDGSKDIILEFAKKDARVVPVFNETNLGLPKSLNKAMRIAKRKYIARMDADDIARSDRFSKQLSYLEKHPEVSVLGSLWKYFPKEHTISVPSDHSEIKIYALMGNPIGHPTVMFRREELVSRVGFYDETAFPIEDYDYWVRGLNKVKFANLPVVLLDYRIHDAQVSQEKALLQEKLSRNLRVAFLRPITLSDAGANQFIEFLDAKAHLTKNQAARMLAVLFVTNFIFGYFARIEFGRFLIRSLKNRRHLFLS